MRRKLMEDDFIERDREWIFSYEWSKSEDGEMAGLIQQSKLFMTDNTD